MIKKLTFLVLLVAAMGLATTLTVIGPWAGTEMDKFVPVLNEFTRQTGIDVEYKIYRAEDLMNVLPAQLYP